MSRFLFDGWQVVIGIETHAQIASRHKLFSPSSTSLLTQAPNTHFNVFDAAFPGTLPRLSRKCLSLAIRAALALKCTINQRSSFDRKHYFYPDLPLGYQITQHYAPFATGGMLKLQNSDIPVRIKQIQMEQDTAKSTLNTRTSTTHIDLNRAGTGLLEIVTEPDLGSPEEAAEYVKTLQSILRAIGASDGNMEAGSFRCDVNVSINRPGEPPGTRCELKNLTGIRFIVGAIKYEMERQKELLTSSPSATVPQETRGFDHNRWETYKLRSKEDAPDYRYMPDPNLGILHISQEEIRQAEKELPDLPDAIRARLNALYMPYGITGHDINVLLNLDAEKEVGLDGENIGGGSVEYFEELCAAGRNPKTVMNWLVNTLIGIMSKLQIPLSRRPNSQHIGELIDLVGDGSLTRATGIQLLRQMLDSPLKPTDSVKELARSLDLISSSSSLMFADLDLYCGQAIKRHVEEVKLIQQGNHKILNKLVGWVMKQTKGKADANQIRKLLEELLKP